jgi:hypothetical protein
MLNWVVSNGCRSEVQKSVMRLPAMTTGPFTGTCVSGV